MKKLNLAVLVLVYAISSLSPVYAIDMETLRSKLNYACTIADIKEADKLAVQNMAMTEQVLFQVDSPHRNNSGARANIIQILKACAETGIITQSHFFDLLLSLYNQIPSITLSTTISQPKAVEMGKAHIRGAVVSLGSDAPLASNFSTFPIMANSLTTAGFIKNRGILNSLTQKVSNAKDLLEKKGADAKNTAINKIQAAASELDAQRGKGVSEDGFQILSGYCKNLITKIQNTP